jgi:hypothetical protein
MTKSSSFDYNAKLHYHAMDEGWEQERGRSTPGISRMLVRRSLETAEKAVVMPKGLCK